MNDTCPVRTGAGSALNLRSMVAVGPVVRHKIHSTNRYDLDGSRRASLLPPWDFGASAYAREAWGPAELSRPLMISLGRSPSRNFLIRIELHESPADGAIGPAPRLESRQNQPRVAIEPAWRGIA